MAGTESAAFLEGLTDTLRAIERILALGEENYRADVFVRLALQRLWITAGNYAEVYRASTDQEPGTEPWAELYLYRCVLAHALADEVDEDRVWEESLRDAPRLRAAIADIEGSG